MRLKPWKAKKEIKGLPYWFKYYVCNDQIEEFNPRVVELDLTNYCNMKPPCPWCQCINVFDNKAVAMTHDTYQRELEFTAVQNTHHGGCGVTIVGGGEPTIHPKWEEYIDEGCKYLESGLISGFNLVTNGLAIDKVKYFLDNTSEPDSWVRISVNDQPIKKNGILQLFKDYPGRIGASIITSGVKAYIKGLKNCFILNEYAKLIRFKRPMDFKHKIKDFSPADCQGRKLARIVEADGNIAYCCQSRGFDGKPRPDACPEGCRWAPVTKEFALKQNLYS